MLPFPYSYGRCCHSVYIVLSLWYLMLQPLHSLRIEDNSFNEEIKNPVTGTVYDITRSIGEGMQGTVDLAVVSAVGAGTNLKTGQLVALKKAHDLLGEDTRGSLQHEFTILQRITGDETNFKSTSAIPKVFELFDDDGTLYMSMEYINGTELGHLTKSEQKSVLLEALDALKVLGQHGISRTDWKPANFMIDGTGRAKLIDFGIANDVGKPVVGQVDLGGLAADIYYAATNEFPMFGGVNGGTNVFDTLCDFREHMRIDIWDVNQKDDSSIAEARAALLQLDNDLTAMEQSSKASAPYVRDGAWYSRQAGQVPDEATEDLYESAEKRSLLKYVLEQFTFLHSLHAELGKAGLHHAEPAHGASCGYEASEDFVESFPAVFHRVRQSWCEMVRDSHILSRLKNDVNVLEREQSRILSGIKYLDALRAQGISTLKGMTYPASEEAWILMGQEQEQKWRLSDPVAAAALILLGEYFEEDNAGLNLMDSSVLIDGKENAERVLEYDVREPLVFASSSATYFEKMCEKRDTVMIQWLTVLLANTHTRRMATSSSAVSKEFDKIINRIREL